VIVVCTYVATHFLFEFEIYGIGIVSISRGGKVITKNWHCLTRVRKSGGGLQLRHLHVALVLRSSYILMVRVIYFDTGM